MSIRLGIRVGSGGAGALLVIALLTESGEPLLIETNEPLLVE